MDWNNMEIGLIAEFCDKYKIGLLVNDGRVTKGINDKKEK